MARMPLDPPIPVDTRAFFRPVSTGLVDLLRGLSREDWKRPTVAKSWVVRDVVAHLLDTTSARPFGGRVDEDDRGRSGWRSVQRHDILDLDEGADA